MNANKEFTEELKKYWTENWDNIDRNTVAKGDLPETLDEWLEELDKEPYSRYWSLTELGWWGMKWHKYESLKRPCIFAVEFSEEDTNSPEIPLDYCLWRYNGKEFLINCETYDAYHTKVTEKVIVKRQYSIVD